MVTDEVPNITPSLPPLEIIEGEDAYETRDLLCARCGRSLPNAPWPKRSAKLVHRPGCPGCGSRNTFPSIPPTVVAEIIEKATFSTVRAPLVEDKEPVPLVYATEKDRLAALQTIEDLIQRTDNVTSRKLYEKQKERISLASTHECGRKERPYRP